jgi:gluconolactonase
MTIETSDGRRVGLARRDVLAGGASLGLLGPAMARAAEVRADFKIMGQGLYFPEGPVAMDDRGVLLVEIGRGTLSRVSPDGTLSVVANLGGGPNGATLGPDGACYVANDGGLGFVKRNGLWGLTDLPATYTGGSIQRVDLKTGAFKTLYTEVNGAKLRGPNDLVFDEWGGLWFTDTGKSHKRVQDHGGLYWARPDGSDIREIAYPLAAPNGICLSPDRRTLYVALGSIRQIAAFDLIGPGQLAMENGAPKMRILASLGGLEAFDSMAMEASGNLVVATVGKGCLTIISPTGEVLSEVLFPEIGVTNLAFGGPDMKTAFVTLSQHGQLAVMKWPRPGLKLLYR